MNTVTVNINGVDYNLRGKEVETYLQEVASFVDGKIREISVTNNKLSIGSAAVLTAINIADELFKCNEELSEITKKRNSLEERHLTLKERLREIKLESDEKNKNVRAEVEELKNIIFAMEAKVSEVDSLNNHIKELNNTIFTLNQEKVKSEKLNLDLNNEIEEISNQNMELKKALVNSRSEIESRVAIEDYDEVKSMNDRLKLNNSEFEKKNNEYKKSIEEYNKEIETLKVSNIELKQSEDTLKKLIIIKENEISELTNIFEESNKEKSEIDISLKKQIESLEEEVKEQINIKETLKAKNKEIKFQLQNAKYRVLDLEKKLMDSQFDLALEKKDKNPLLR